jgi:hypothetical protein
LLARWSSREPGFAANAKLLLGDIATHPGCCDPQIAEAHYRQALVLGEQRDMHPLTAQCHFGLGKLYLRTGKRKRAYNHLSIATAMYRGMDMRFWLGQAEAELRQLQ